MLTKIHKWPKLAILSLIRLYQHTLSPDSGWFRTYYPQGFCPFEPHCSEYCYQAIEKYGIFRGTYRGIWRVCRCHPWTKGGYDPA